MLTAKDTEENKTRLENVRELKSSILSYLENTDNPSLAGFLEEIALYTDLEQYNDSDDAVVMMTMHSAKGLEFGTVFVPSLVDMIVPNGSAKMRGETEEERRLFYVASTRARDRLIFSSYTGQENGEYVRLSPFLEEIGIKTLEENENDRDKGSK